MPFKGTAGKATELYENLWLQLDENPLSGNCPLPILPLGCIFKCLLSLMAFFLTFPTGGPSSQFLMCLTVAIMKKIKPYLTTPFLCLQSPNMEPPPLLS